MILDGQHYYETIRAVEGVATDDAFTVHFEEGSTFCPRNPHHLPLPKPGDVARLYGRGFGYTVRGFAVGEVVYHYETEADSDERHRRECDEAKAKRAQEFADGRAEFDRQVDALPEPFRARIRRFLLIKEEWGADHGRYELFCCTEAVKIAEALRDDAAIVSFAQGSNEQQKLLIPGLAYDQHSGNTFGTACLLARVYVTKPGTLPTHHGALCPMVGCRDYGCWAAHEALTEA